MSLADDFLAHAVASAAAQTTTTDHISLRRLVSASYYALFHRLVEDAVSVIGPNVSLEINHRMQRWFEHNTIKQICGRFLAPQLTQPLNSLVGGSVFVDLRIVCRAFISLQEERHDADYNPSYAINPKEALQNLESAVTAIYAWKRVRKTSEANVFILSLLLFKNWERER